LLEERARGAGITEIASEHIHRSAVFFAQLTRERLKTIHASRAKHKCRTVRGKHSGVIRTDATRSSCDECPMTFEVHGIGMSQIPAAEQD
jgi:hypothetical protein